MNPASIFYSKVRQFGFIFCFFCLFWWLCIQELFLVVCGEHEIPEIPHELATCKASDLTAVLLLQSLLSSFILAFEGRGSKKFYYSKSYMCMKKYIVYVRELVEMAVNLYDRT